MASFTLLRRDQIFVVVVNDLRHYARALVALVHEGRHARLGGPQGGSFDIGAKHSRSGTVLFLEN